LALRGQCQAAPSASGFGLSALTFLKPVVWSLLLGHAAYIYGDEYEALGWGPNRRPLLFNNGFNEFNGNHHRSSLLNVKF
jgi:hypothetical protein